METAWAAPRVRRAPAAASEKSRSRSGGHVEGVDDLHPGKQSRERDLDRAQLAHVCRGDHLEDERGEDAEDADGEQDLYPLPRARASRRRRPSGHRAGRCEGGAGDGQLRPPRHRPGCLSGQRPRSPGGTYGVLRRERGVRAPGPSRQTDVRASGASAHRARGPAAPRGPTAPGGPPRPLAGVA